ncbi:MAG: adenylyltransferase/cytidyltransferase family protein [Bacteroidia bacterium]|nr:adenylyltransferase/cytidyltransferase family protein [Bacteroidia bacterium]
MDYSHIIPAKIHHTVETFRHELNRLKFFNKKIVFTNGCFDILHHGHIDYLIKAAALGDYLIIGLNTDSSVRRNKGIKRPINDEQSRALLLASLRFVDAVFLFDSQTPADLIRDIIPDVLVKGADYKPEEIAGYDTVVSHGGQVLTIDLLPGFSTSLIEKRIMDLNR